jgi:hypothetical protein
LGQSAEKQNTDVPEERSSSFSYPSPIVPPQEKIDPVQRIKFLLLDVRIDGYDDCHIKYGIYLSDLDIIIFINLHQQNHIPVQCWRGL